jgi:flagellar basal-body rod modification protein FlgD
MTVTSSTSATPSTATANTSAAANTASGSMDMSSFISLMTTEMKNQDPTQPVDETAMVTQMAQMSSLAGINTTNTTLSGIATTLDSILASQQAAANANASTSGTPAATA